MQLFVHITNHEENITPIFKRLIEAGIQGATVVDCQGMLTTLSECNMEDAPPIFGSLRQFINHQDFLLNNLETPQMISQ